MSQAAALDLLSRYYAAFNSGDRETFFSLLADDVVHDLNQGGSETGVEVFRAFMTRMDRCYRERLEDLVIFANEDGSRAAAEFTVHGTYLATDEGLPEAAGQTYVLPAGAFFTLREGKVARVTMYYNLQEWLRQVGAA
ncbi:nuclear transport factor 2 family protein [Luteolibacter ambystomatis]|uniref:Nuclear transport factor 2 family protein n=1 Tax=Luteolibacter ambystomatis TaxID=2824561 RepID=A0A975G719_9BACT|nr:ketosteroid isomerase-related protein [Luteolibacter ambystomatis]QUE49970.1 nuclear transport factor 2 family protein [Luteolibacter ambystomatis]